MEKNNTKQDILEAALNLFSYQGFEATSVFQIAEAVGIRKASLYSHFSGKQEILDTLLEEIMQQYNKHSVFACADWNDPKFTEKMQSMTSEEIVEMITAHIKYILHDPHISKARKMLCIEQFRNENLSKLQTKQNYSDILNYFIHCVKLWGECGKIVKGDTELMAAQLCLPITVLINLCDREPSREDEVADLIKRHVAQFFKLYQTKC